MTSVVVLTTGRAFGPYSGLRPEGVRTAAVGRGGGCRGQGHGARA